MAASKCKRLLSTYHVSSLKLGMLILACNPGTWELEKGGLQVQGQPGLRSRTLSPKTKPNKELV